MTLDHVLKLMHHAQLKPLSLAARFVYVYILNKGEDLYSLRFLASELGISYVTAKNAVDALLKADLLVELEPSIGTRATRLSAKNII